MSFGDWLVIAAVVVAIALASWWFTRAMNAAAGRLFDLALADHVANAKYPKHRFDPASAVLVRERAALKSRGRVEQIERVYKTPTGEYFLFICTTGQLGYLAPLTQIQAMNALRSDPKIYRREFP